MRRLNLLDAVSFTRLCALCVVVAIVAATLGRTSADDEGRDKKPLKPAAPKTQAAEEEPKLPELKPTKRLSGFSDWVVSVEFSPDGKHLAAGGYDVVKLFDAKTYSPAATLKTRCGYAHALAFSPDSKWLAVGGYRKFYVYDVATQKRVNEIKDHKGYITDVAFSSDGKLTATACDDEVVRLYDAADGFKPGPTITSEHEFPFQGVAFSPDGKTLATAEGDEDRITKAGYVTLWDAATGTKQVEFPIHEKVANSVAFSSDGKWLISTSMDETVSVYDVAAAKGHGFYNEHGRPTNAAVFARDDETIVSAAGGRAKGKNDLRVWSRVDGTEYAVLKGHEKRVQDVALSPDGHTVASGGYDDAVLIWDVAAVLPGAAKKSDAPDGSKVIRVGIIGLDTSHVGAFTKVFNDEKAEADVAGFKVVAAYPQGSPDIESSTSRVPKYTEDMQKQGVEIVDSIDELLEKVDAVLLETNDGRPHLEQLLPCLKAGKRTFIDKPVAGSLADAVAIFAASKHYKTPVFSSSSLRYGKGTQAVRGGKIGDVLGCDTYSPCSLEKTHPDLYWYGIHGVESLFTVMQTGCKTVARTSTPDFEFVVGTWEDGRVGTFRGIRKGKGGYGGRAFGTKGIEPVGDYGGYRPLVVEIAKFFKTGEPPVDEAETLEIYAFMEAADESKRQGGKPVTIDSVMEKAKKAAAERLGDELE